MMAMMMDFGSLRRNASERSKENRKKTFSISNFSFTSDNSSTTVIRKSLNISLPRDLGLQQDVDSRVVKVGKGGSAHLSGVIQVGDLVNVFPNELDIRNSPVGDEGYPLTRHNPHHHAHRLDDEFVNVNILYGVLQVESRPLCPLVVEIGNRNNTSLGLALADSPGEKIRISSIQPGSLAERCGYLKPGDILISIQVGESEKISCSPYYTSFDTAQIIRRIASSMPSVIFTVLPYEAEQLQLQQQHISLFNMLSSTGGGGGGGGNNVQVHYNKGRACSSHNSNNNKKFGSESTLIPDCGQQNEEEDETNGGDDSSFQDGDDFGESGAVDEDGDGDQVGNGAGSSSREDDLDYTVLSFSLWKDRLYEDFGFSLTDSTDDAETKDGEHVPDGAGSGESISNKCSEMRTPDSPSSSSGRINSSHGQHCHKHPYPCSPCSSSSAGGTGSEILQIRPGGPAYGAGLLPGDRIMQINHQDVSHLESTMLVPILASLDDSLNLTVIRINNEIKSS